MYFLQFPRAILPLSRFLALAAALAVVAGCKKKDAAEIPPRPEKAVATAEGQTQVIRPPTAAATNTPPAH